MSGKNDGLEWTSIADMMSGLMIVFLLLAISFISEAQETYQKYVSVSEQIYAELMHEFEQDLHHWNAELDEKTLSLRFNEPDVLFENGSSKPNAKFRAIIADFFPRYAFILSQPEYSDAIDEIRIEGHTSSLGRAGETDVNDKYFFNLVLSQDRARQTLYYSLESFSRSADWEIRRWLRSKLTATGYSSSRLIMTEIGGVTVEDERRSRRVEFRIRLLTDDILDSLDHFGNYNEN